MSIALNEDIAGRLDEVARILAEQGANRFRVQAYHQAAAVLRGLTQPVSAIFGAEGLAGLEKLPGVGDSIARAIRDVLLHGRLAMLDRLRGDHDPVALLTSVPGIGKSLAWKLHDELGLESLEALESAAHDGRLETVAGLGAKRLAGIRDSLAHRLGRVRQPRPPTLPSVATGEPTVEELLDVDTEYRREAAAGTLKKIAPRRLNPSGEAWLPVLHTTRGERHYTALFSNTARAHELHKTHDWVVLYYDGRNGEQQCTVITSEFGRLKGLRIVRGREAECADHYQRRGAFRTCPKAGSGCR
ncbi:MAG TPA: helix-hairpin-helix domain-containing protein [Verrucomicrobiae bacterium]|nr:helix-hairpin-helix domain-containing protein [Verrucomicrobiae bacterium]